MIKIKDYIFNENDIHHIHEYKKDAYVYIDKENKYIIKNATFEDIEWNYGENENNKLRKDNNELVETNMKLAVKNKELEEENEKLNNRIHDITGTLNETYNNRTKLRNENKKLKLRIDKAIEYIVTNREPVDERDGEVSFWLSDKFDEEDLLKILKGEEND